MDAWLPDATRAHLQQIGALRDAALAAGTCSRHFLNRLWVDLSWNSSRLEGNTYSLPATRRLLEAGSMASGHRHWGHGCCSTQAGTSSFSPALIRGWIPVRFWVCMHCWRTTCYPIRLRAGERLRTRAVGIEQSPHTPPTVPQLIEESFMQLIDKAAAIGNANERSFFLIVQLPYLQPFENVNKCVSRLAANVPLLLWRQQLLCRLYFVDLPEDDYVKGLLGVYEMGRSICCAMCFCGRVSALPSAVSRCASHWASQTLSACVTAAPWRGGGTGRWQQHRPCCYASALPLLFVHHSHSRPGPFSAGSGSRIA